MPKIGNKVFDYSKAGISAAKKVAHKAGAPLRFAKSTYKKLEVREARKKAASPYEYTRVGNQLIRSKRK